MAIYLGDGKYDTRKGIIKLEDLKEILEELREEQDIFYLIEEIFDVYSKEALKEKYKEGYEECKNKIYSLIDNL